jgi:hypothetical protein
MVVAARRDERCLVAVALLLLEAEDVPVEGERSIEIRHLQMYVPNVYARIDRSSHVPMMHQRPSRPGA